MSESSEVRRGIFAIILIIIIFVSILGTWTILSVTDYSTKLKETFGSSKGSGGAAVIVHILPEDSDEEVALNEEG